MAFGCVVCVVKKVSWSNRDMDLGLVLELSTVK